MAWTGTNLSLDYNGENLVFIVGCPRSGTTYLQRLIAAHPKVHTGQESDIFDLYVGPLLRTWRRELQNYSGRGGVGLACYLREDEFIAILKEFLLNLLRPMLKELGPGEIFLEKTPSHALFIPEIHELLPKARFIHILRDPRDVVASLLAVARSWGKAWAPKNAALAAFLWRRHLQAVNRARLLLPGDQFFEVRYEQLWENPIDTLKQVSHFIGLEWSVEEIKVAVETNRPDIVQKGGELPFPRRESSG
ncbi:MAG: sulfotransferase [Chloroflexi bacterium]|nr:sulfotransferase [Chloroflexota bacterium]